MKNKKVLIIALAGLLVLLLAVVGICGVMMIKENGGADSPYQKNLDLGNKYFESGNYDQAIAYYRAAISADPTQDGPYYQLATMYISLSRMTEAKEVLEEGIQKTSSQRLTDLYNMHFSTNESNDGDTADDSVNAETDKTTVQEEVYFNSSVFDIMANYTFENYNVQYTNMNISNANDIYKVRVLGFNGELYFYNESTAEVSIDANKKAPYDKVRPNYIVLDTLADIITGVEKGPVSTDGLYSMGASNVDIMYDAELDRSVQFTYRNCVVKIALDANDCITATAKHKIFSEFGTGAATAQLSKSYPGTIKVINATDAQGVQGAKANVRAFNDRFGTIIAEATTQSNGEFTVSLEEGKYTVEIICDGFVTEYFDFEVYSTGVFSINTITISPVLGAGQIRIVLEWGDQPRDLDSYLVDSTGTTQVYFGDRTWYDNGRLIAELDVDDQSGYGPETITIYDTSIDFTYCVHDYSETGSMFGRTDVTVKVYMNDGLGQSYVIPLTNETANGWIVFSYVGGSIRTVDQSVPDRYDFRHVG